MNIKLIVIIAVIVLAYQYMTRPVTASARDLDPSCDVVIFTTPSGPYCRRARNVLESSNVAWCEKDIQNNADNYNTFRELGGKGVPLSVVGEQIVYGFQENAYRQAISNL